MIPVPYVFLICSPLDIEFISKNPMISIEKNVEESAYEKKK